MTQMFMTTAKLLSTLETAWMLFCLFVCLLLIWTMSQKIADIFYLFQAVNKSKSLTNNQEIWMPRTNGRQISQPFALMSMANVTHSQNPYFKQNEKKLCRVPGTLKTVYYLLQIDLTVPNSTFKWIKKQTNKNKNSTCRFHRAMCRTLTPNMKWNLTRYYINYSRVCLLSNQFKLNLQWLTATNSNATL